MALWPRLAHLPIALVLAVTGAAYWADLGNPFFGSDTWPWLVSTRVTSASDFMRVAFSPIMSGTRFVAEVALFYHPLTALSYSLDQALFGLNPAPFYATNLVLHLVAVAALYSLARGLGASWWAASACALILGVHPIAAATVPSLPRRQDLVVGALLLGSMSLLARAGVGEPRIRWPGLVGALALFFLALGGKEIAYAGLVSVPLVLMAAWERSQAETTAPGSVRADWERSQLRRVRPRVVLRRSLVLGLGFVVLEAIAFGVRWRVLGGLGGYFGAPAVLSGSQGVLEFFVRPYVTDVLWPFQSVLPDRLRDWLLLMGLAALVATVAIAGLPRQRQLMALVGVVWQAAFLGLYAVVHTSLSAYLLYVPLAGLALLVAAVLDGVVDRWKRGGLPAAGAAIFLVGIMRASLLGTDYPEFRDAARISKQFIDQAVPCLESAPSGATVYVDGLPHRIDYPSVQSQFVDAFVFEPYSLESVVRLLAPDATASVTVRSTQDVHVQAPSVAVACSHAGDDWQISVSGL